MNPRAVSFLQDRLGLPVTGKETPALTQAVSKWQQQTPGLKADGIYGPITNRAMTARALGAVKVVAKDFGLDPLAFQALIDVETSGTGFLDDGRPKILLERHYVYRLATAAQRAALPASVCYPTAGGYGAPGANQWDRFEIVAAVDLDLAIRSVSWGLGQVMGDNWKTIGEQSPQLMMIRAGRDERTQLEQMAAFIVTKAGLKAAINAHDWLTVAKLYNGPAQQGYDTKLTVAFAAVR